jgi:hypothetical protein
VTKQRTNKKKGSLSAARIKRLNAEGFIWKPFEEAWELRFAAFLKFKKRERHCFVPADHIEEGFSLGTWLVNQRRKKRDGSLRPEREKRLEAEGSQEASLWS